MSGTNQLLFLRLCNADDIRNCSGAGQKSVVWLLFSFDPGRPRQPIRHVHPAGSLPTRRHLHQHGHRPGLRVQELGLRRTFLRERSVGHPSIRNWISSLFFHVHPPLIQLKAEFSWSTNLFTPTGMCQRRAGGCLTSAFGVGLWFCWKKTGRPVNSWPFVRADQDCRRLLTSLWWICHQMGHCSQEFRLLLDGVSEAGPLIAQWLALFRDCRGQDWHSSRAGWSDVKKKKERSRPSARPSTLVTRVNFVESCLIELSATLIAIFWPLWSVIFCPVYLPVWLSCPLLAKGPANDAGESDQLLYTQTALLIRSRHRSRHSWRHPQRTTCSMAAGKIQVDNRRPRSIHSPWWWPSQQNLGVVIE